MAEPSPCATCGPLATLVLACSLRGAGFSAAFGFGAGATVGLCFFIVCCLRSSSTHLSSALPVLLLVRTIASIGHIAIGRSLSVNTTS